MLVINASLSKYQMYKPKDQINKVPTISQQDDIEFFSKYSFPNVLSRHFANV